MTETYTTAPAAALPSRLPRPRAYLMCPPDHFTVQYSINPWMASGEPVDTARAMLQWQLLRDTYRSLGHSVHLIDALPGLPDMVFAANGATVIGGGAGRPVPLPERAAEGPPTWTGSGARLHGGPGAAAHQRGRGGHRPYGPGDPGRPRLPHRA